MATNHPLSKSVFIFSKANSSSISFDKFGLLFMALAHTHSRKGIGCSWDNKVSFIYKSIIHIEIYVGQHINIYHKNELITKECSCNGQPKRSRVILHSIIEIRYSSEFLLRAALRNSSKCNSISNTSDQYINVGFLCFTCLCHEIKPHCWLVSAIFLCWNEWPVHETINPACCNSVNILVSHNIMTCY